MVKYFFKIIIIFFIIEFIIRMKINFIFRIQIINYQKNFLSLASKLMYLYSIILFLRTV